MRCMLAGQTEYVLSVYKKIGDFPPDCIRLFAMPGYVPVVSTSFTKDLLSALGLHG